MPEDQKKKYYSENQNRATQKYQKEHLEQINFRVKKGEKQKYIDAAAAEGVSLAKFFLLAADDRIERRQNGEITHD